MDYGKIRENFEKHGFAVQHYANKEDAKRYLVGELKGKSIGFGGSVTLLEMDLYNALQENNEVVWHNRIAGNEIRSFANSASVYITSANAVTETGEIVNIDATGNRISMMAYGPDKCYYIIGKNKITKDIETALHRCKNIAAPRNAQRLKAKTPCAKNGDKCYDCSSPDRICRITMIMDRAPKSMISEIMFIDEALGL